MEPRAVVERLKEFGRTRDEGKLDMETRKLIRVFHPAEPDPRMDETGIV